MELIEKIQKWGEMNPGIQAIVKIGVDRSVELQFFVVVDDYLEFILKINWIGNFGSVNKFHTRELSDNLHSMSVLYDHGSTVTFLFLEHCYPDGPSPDQVSGYLEKGSQVIVNKVGYWDTFLNNHNNKASRTPTR